MKTNAWIIVAIIIAIGTATSLFEYEREQQYTQQHIAVSLIGHTNKLADDPLAGYTYDDLNTAAWKLLTPNPTCDEAYLGGTVADCDSALVTVMAWRKQYANYQPKRMRDVIMSTLDYMETHLKELRQDNITQASKKHMDEYEKRTDADLSRADDVIGILNKLNPQPGTPSKDIVQGVSSIITTSSGPQSFTTAYCNPGETFTVGAYSFDCVDSQWHLKEGPPQP